MKLYKLLRHVTGLSEGCVYDIFNDSDDIVLKDVYLFVTTANEGYAIEVSLRYAGTGEVAENSDSVIRMLIGNFFYSELRFYPYPVAYPKEE